MEDIQNKKVYLNGKLIITNMREAKIVSPNTDFGSIHINETAIYEPQKQNVDKVYNSVS